MTHNTRKNNVKHLVTAALFAAIIAVLSQIQIPVQPIPFNLAVLGVFLSGVMLTPVYSAVSVLIYIMLGFIGIPVFAGFMSGPGAIFGMTGGYIWGYLLIALFTSIGANKFKNIFAAVLFMGLGLALCYACGTAWFMFVSKNNLAASLAACVFPFILPDIGKAIFAYTVGKAIKLQLIKARLY